jgi:DMSO/TMAO reductase YedYZ molybdopterin-dependent catalytic subunit
MDDDGLRELGWLPVRLEEGDVQEKFVGSVFAILPSEVVETKIWRSCTAEEQAEIDSQKAADVRRQRNSKLTECDWTQLNDTPLDNAAKIQWTAYRQALRDVPSQAGFPHNVVWPTKP